MAGVAPDDVKAPRTQEQPLGSDFIADHELPPLLNAAEKEGLVILWVYLSSCLYDETEIGSYQAAHDISKPLDRLTPAKRRAVLVEVCRKIKGAANILNPSGRPSIGVPQRALPSELIPSSLTPRKYAFAMIRDLVPEYKEFLTPMLSDQNLGEKFELGILMIGSPASERQNKNSQAPWTLFVKPDWLRWILLTKLADKRPQSLKANWF